MDSVTLERSFVSHNNGIQLVNRFFFWPSDQNFGGCILFQGKGWHPLPLTGWRPLWAILDSPLVVIILMSCIMITFLAKLY